MDKVVISVSRACLSMRQQMLIILNSNTKQYNTLWKGLSVRLVALGLRLRPQRAGLRLAKKLVVFDVAPANRDLAELAPLAPVGVDRPEPPNEVAKENRSV